MNTLTTRKIVLGLLMVLVLAFSVQSIADALTFGTSRSGDLVTVSPNQPFTIRFSVNLRSPEAVNPDTRRASTTDIGYASGDRVRPGPSNDQVSHTITTDTGYTDGDTHYYTVTTTATQQNNAGNDITVTTHTRNWLTESEAYYYNDEAIKIIPDGLTLMRGSATFGTSSYDLTETDENRDRRLSGSMTLTGSHDIPGEYDIEIDDSTPGNDYPADGDPDPPTIMFTIFVVDRDADAPKAQWGFTDLDDDDEGYKVGGDDFTDDAITTRSTSYDIRVEYSVIEGSGRLYVQKGTRKTSSNRTISTSSAAVVRLDMNGTTNKVRASISGAAPKTATFIFGHPEVAIVSGDGQEGIFGGQLDDPLVVKVTDGRGRALSGLAAVFDSGATGSMFIPVPGTTVYTKMAAGIELAAEWTPYTREATSTRPPPAADIAVQTDSSGEASTYFQLGTTETQTSQTVTVMAAGSELIVPPNFRFDAVSSEKRPTLHILSGNNQTTDSDGDIEDPLIVVVRQDGKIKRDELVTFHTVKGTLIGENDKGEEGDPAKRVFGTTDSKGQASVEYYQDPGEGSDTVTATISGEDYEKEVIFGINGGRTTGGGSDQPEPQQQTGRLEIDVSGEGETRTVTVAAITAAGLVSPVPIFVTLTGTALTSTEFVSTGTATEITVPTTPGVYTLTATASVAGYTPDTENITVAGPTSLGRISISQIGSPNNGMQTFSITVVDTGGSRISGALTVTVSGAGFTTRSVPIAQGSGAVNITLPTPAGAYTLTASAQGYESGTAPVRIAGTEIADAEEEEEVEEPTVREPDSISIVGPSQRSGTANTELDAALIVQVVDNVGDAVEDARVIFRVRSGQGRLSERGNGRAIAVQTDSSGYGRATYTPLNGGTHTVEAEARGVTRTVEFTITIDGAPAPGTRDADTPPSGTVSPVVHVGAAQRPPMLWVDGGAIYALVGKDVQAFAPGVDNAMNIAVGGGKVYWTEKTGESSGTINSANFDGTNVQELASILSVPMGIAVDTAGSALYWTNSRGRIQRANLDGSGIENVLEHLTSPLDIALSETGNVYWTHSNGGVGFMNLKGPQQIRNISNGADAAGSLVIAGGKLYWTERTGDSGGTINRANLNGSGVTELVSILAVPSGIAVDGSRSKLYWTNSRGRVQRADLDGSGIQNVVDGLGSPGDLVLSNSISAPASTPTTTTPTTAGKSKYDVNGDGTVDNTDAGLVSDALGTNNTQYDVDGNGTVNFLDLLLVFDNRDAGAAGAPTVVGMKLSAVQIDRIQEQIDLLIATGDRSPAAMRTLIYLQQLIATARPEKTQLLANYPNPFNPETWIPYELARDTTVKITIYNTQGVVIRTLALGHQSAGYYTGRDRAAYWDGRNAQGERVASGIYFYQFETDDMSSMRKMVILK